ncbi:invasion associated locus B family protein [Camelimonas abortus]|uniref:Invasion associated locus B family protein n=1 Tax=Camelimonas abortus TaxID=1017184 RepID=A0ABV7LEL0_9HYPH
MAFNTRSAGVRATRGAAALLALGAALAPAAAFAQAKPAQQQQQQQQQQQAPQPPAGPVVVSVKPEPSQADWTKVCGKDPVAGREICYTTRDFVSDQGQPVLAVAVYDVKGEQQKMMRFLLPLGLLLQPGIRVTIDQGQPIEGRYALCFPNGCFAEAQIKDSDVAAMKKGQNLNVSVQNQAANVVTFQVPLAGFAKGFDGPGIDPKVLEEQQRKLQEAMQKKAQEEAQKHQQQQQGGQKK